MPEFTRDESDNYIIYEEMSNKTNEELIIEYRKLLDARKKGQDRFYNLQLSFDTIRTIAEQRNFDLHKALASGSPAAMDKWAQIGVQKTDITDSSLVVAIGYDRLEKILYVELKTSETIYPYYNVPEDVFTEFVNTDSKGKYFNKNIRNKKSKPTK